MPQNKNLPQICLSEGGFGKTAAVSVDGETVRLKAPPRKRCKGGGGKPEYTGGFAIVLRKIWAFFSYRCGKILAAFMREQMGFLEQPFRITEKTRNLLSKEKAGQNRENS
jgi:hypothetical protein